MCLGNIRPVEHVESLRIDADAGTHSDELSLMPYAEEEPFPGERSRGAEHVVERDRDGIAFTLTVCTDDIEDAGDVFFPEPLECASFAFTFPHAFCVVAFHFINEGHGINV